MSKKTRKLQNVILLTFFLLTVFSLTLGRLFDNDNNVMFSITKLTPYKSVPMLLERRGRVLSFTSVLAGPFSPKCLDEPKISYDRLWIACSVGTTMTSAMYVMDTRGGSFRVVSFGDNHRYPSWNPSNSLAFIAQAPSNVWGILITSPFKKENSVWIPMHDWLVYPLLWSPNGRYLAFGDGKEIVIFDSKSLTAQIRLNITPDSQWKVRLSSWKDDHSLNIEYWFQDNVDSVGTLVMGNN